MAKIVSTGDFRNPVYSVNISEEERKLLQTSETGSSLILECNTKKRVLKRLALSELSERVNIELQRLRSLANLETRRVNLGDAEATRHGFVSPGERK